MKTLRLSSALFAVVLTVGLSSEARAGVPE